MGQEKREVRAGLTEGCCGWAQEPQRWWVWDCEHRNADIASTSDKWKFMQMLHLWLFVLLCCFFSLHLSVVVLVNLLKLALLITSAMTGIIWYITSFLLLPSPEQTACQVRLPADLHKDFIVFLCRSANKQIGRIFRGVNATEGTVGLFNSVREISFVDSEGWTELCLTSSYNWTHL